MKKKLIVIGYARHGKDQFCEIINKLFGYKSVSSSIFMSEIVFEKIGKLYGYKNPKECWLDRGSHRKEWYDIIVNYNTPDSSRLGEEIFKNYDIYCGMRNIKELNELKKRELYDLAIWIDASKRLPPEKSESMTISENDCDIIFDNNEFFEDIKQFEQKVYLFCKANLLA